MHKVNVQIGSNLSDQEKKIFEIINRVRAKYTPSTVVRVAGGWVRDKLLGKPSDDIDLMTDNISGSQFADMISKELGLKGPHVIEKNPEKTKNIEAAKMHIPINGEQVELDFVQARTEEYGSNRREVVTRPATAEEDAMRRDLTIGALFYNINENKVEDFTGKGITDLITGTIRTPFDDGSSDVTPEKINQVKQTFIEDPLRIFRAIRFAAKYNGNISPVTKAALGDPEVIHACFHSERKIATERIGQEIQKVLKGANPNVAFRILKETGLMQEMLNESIKGSEYEGNMEGLDMDQNNPHHEFNLWEHTMAVFENLQPMLDGMPEEKRVMMLLAAITHDLGKLYRKMHGQSSTHPGRTSYHDHEKASQKLAELLLKYLKFENTVVSQVAGLARYHMQPHGLDRGDGGISAIRKFIRRMGEQSINWADVISLSTADAYSKGAKVDPAVVENYKSLRAKMEEALASLTITDSKNKVEPILNGNEIMNALGIKPGPHMREISEFIASLRDDNPSITKDEAIAKLKEKFGGDQNQIVSQAKAIREKRMGICCPQQLFESKFNDINNLILTGKSVEALSVLNSLRDEYGKDPKVAKLTAINTFKILKEDISLKDNDLLQYIFDHAEHDFFDPIIGSHTVGLLLLMETPTEPNVVMEIGKRVSKLSPGIMRSVLDGLPADIPNKKLKARLEDHINEAL